MKVVIYILLLFMLLQSIYCQNIISTIAGSSTSVSYSGDGGQATSTALNYPFGVAVDASGRILYYCALHWYTVICAVSDNIVDNHKLIFACPI